MTTAHDHRGGTTTRRTFIQAGSALLAGAVLFRGEIPTAPSGLATMASADGPHLGVGYVEGSAGVTSLVALGSLLSAGRARAGPAASLGGGDLRGTAAAVTVHGFGPGVRSALPGGVAGASGGACADSCRFDRVFVDAHVPSPDPSAGSDTVPFYAWTYRRAPSMSAQPSRFVVGAGSDLRVGFRVEATPATGAARSATTVFTSAGRGRGSLPGLQRGVYLLGLDEGAWASATTLPAADDPAWSGLASVVVSVHDA